MVHLLKRGLTTGQQHGQPTIQHKNGEEERIYNENHESLEQDEEIRCKTAKPMNGHYETWHIKKPLMGRSKDAT
jgi:hypothetical protein